MSEVHKCPVCLGNGKVPEGFYNTTFQEEGWLKWTSSGCGSEPCKSCNGLGILWDPFPQQQREDQS